MISYTKKTDMFGGEYIEGINGDTVLQIPIEPANSDYQRYLLWLKDPTAEEGGTLS